MDETLHQIPSIDLSDMFVMQALQSILDKFVVKVTYSHFEFAIDLGTRQAEVFVWFTEKESIIGLFYFYFFAL